MLSACKSLTPAGVWSANAVDVIVVVVTVNRSHRMPVAVRYCAKNRPSVPTLHTSHGQAGRYRSSGTDAYAVTSK